MMGNPDHMDEIRKWNERAGDREPAATKVTEVSTLAPVMCWAAEIDAMAKRLLELEERVARAGNDQMLWTDIHSGRLHILSARRRLGKQPNADISHSHD